MKLDTVIVHRFEELQQRAEEISKHRKIATDVVGSETYYRVPTAAVAQWLTNALNIVQRAMGEDSVHFERLTKFAKEFREYESEFLRCKAVLLAAQEDYEGGYLFSVRALIKAESLEDTIEQARKSLRLAIRTQLVFWQVFRLSKQ